MNKKKAEIRNFEKNEILDFIERRFSKTNANWDSGNCYYFSVILDNRFNHCGEIVYDPIVGHFKYRYKKICYDINGINNQNMKDLIPLTRLYMFDRNWYNRIIRDCVL